MRFEVAPLPLDVVVCFFLWTGIVPSLWEFVWNVSRNGICLYYYLVYPSLGRLYFTHNSGWHLKPVWGMNYFGVIRRPDKITSSQAGQMIMKSLSRMYTEGRFLGGFEHQEGSLRYVDQITGAVRSFQGREYLSLADEVVYEPLYHGGLLRD